MYWTYSNLKEFKTCPRQYHELRILKKYPQQKSTVVLYGRELHTAAEMYIKNTATPIDPRFKFMQAVIDAMLWKKGVRHAEFKMAVTPDLVPCAWDSKDRWVRGIADLLIVDEKLAWVVDWKTGRADYPDPEQLTLMALLVLAHYPEIDRVNAALMFVVAGACKKMKIRREEAPALWWKFREDVARLQTAHTGGQWPPNQSGLCKRHCDVLSCEFNGKYFDKRVEGEHHAVHKVPPPVQARVRNAEKTPR